LNDFKLDFAPELIYDGVGLVTFVSPALACSSFRDSSMSIIICRYRSFVLTMHTWPNNENDHKDVLFACLSCFQ